MTAGKRKAKWQHSILHREDNIAQRHFKSSVIESTIPSRTRACAYGLAPCAARFSYAVYLLLLVLKYLCFPYVSRIFLVDVPRMPNRHFSASTRYESEKLATRASFINSRSAEHVYIRYIHTNMIISLISPSFGAGKKTLFQRRTSITFISRCGIKRKCEGERKRFKTIILRSPIR